MGIEEEVARLRRDAASAQQRHARAVADVAQHDARAEAVRENLRDEFGVDTVAAAREKMTGLKARMETEAAEVRRQLELSGGEQ